MRINKYANLSYLFLTSIWSKKYRPGYGLKINKHLTAATSTQVKGLQVNNSTYEKGVKPQFIQVCVCSTTLRRALFPVSPFSALTSSSHVECIP